jgi:hypothetical protein|tara:strand:+ start:7974 stop:8078 length:105 start_codon:yes stop_codon:yes gene_type:complete
MTMHKGKKCTLNQPPKKDKMPKGKSAKGYASKAK